MKKTHKCGCITEDYLDGVRFVEICRRHKQNGKIVYIALQHNEKGAVRVPLMEKDFKILDVGSGIKKYGNLQLEGDNVFHVDIDRNAFHVEVVCDIQHLPFKDCSFDIVHASHILEHVNSPSDSLKELNRVSKKWIILKVPDASWYNYIINPEESPGHIYSWNSYTLRNLMQRHFPYVKIRSTKRRLIALKESDDRQQSKMKTLKLILLVWLIGTNELTAICRKGRLENIEKE